MKARAVIGANFGDEGKGLVVDYLCATQDAGFVVRFNGGAQAGHTVVMPDGRRHVFRHFGSGTFRGIPTYLSQFFVVNPMLFFWELKQLIAMGVTPLVYAHPDCIVTTHADMLINQRIEDKRGDARHGSCGIGVFETVQRSGVAELKITMSDLWNRASSIESKLERICGDWAAYRSGSKIDDPAMAKSFIECCWQFADVVEPRGIAQCLDPIFEGAQGLLMDQDNKEFYPHLTPSNTGVKNVRKLCHDAGIDEIDAYYVTRPYLTRHGAGPLPGEDQTLLYVDDTNRDHKYQGRLRFAPLDGAGPLNRARADFGGACKLVVTHCDQAEPPAYGDLFSYGETARDVERCASRPVIAA